MKVHIINQEEEVVADLNIATESFYDLEDFCNGLGYNLKEVRLDDKNQMNLFDS